MLCRLQRTVFLTVVYAGFRSKMTEKNSRSQRLYGVPGFDHRKNNVILQNSKKKNTQSAVIFFGGDVQDFPEIMQVCQGRRQGEGLAGWRFLLPRQDFGKRFLDIGS